LANGVTLIVAVLDNQKSPLVKKGRCLSDHGLQGRETISTRNQGAYRLKAKSVKVRILFGDIRRIGNNEAVASASQSGIPIGTYEINILGAKSRCVILCDI
jgi:hypothetical protein